MNEKHTHTDEMREDKSGTHIDPICGMTVNPATAAGSFRHEGATYYFCSKGCLQKFINQASGAPTANNLVQLGRKKETARHGEMTATPQGEFIDPVCGMSVAPETAAGKYDFQNRNFLFLLDGLS